MRILQSIKTSFTVGLFFISFNNLSLRNNVIAQNINLKASLKKNDSLKNKSYTVSTKPEIFETAFFEGTEVNVDTFHLSFYCIDIGKIKIESGKIIAADPIMVRDTKPFVQNFPIGQFPVHLAIARFRNDARVAFSRIFFSDKPVTKWEFAIEVGQKQIPISGKKRYGFGVDAGTAVYLDEKANDAFNELEKKDNTIWEEAFINELEKNSYSTYNYAIYNFEEHNLATFSTGMGDGFYSTYVGYDENGNICRLLTDFNFVPWWKK